MLLDVGGQDATEPFEDVGHSDEAREILDGLLVGNLKRMVRCSQAQELDCSRCAWFSNFSTLPGADPAIAFSIHVFNNTVADAIRSCSQAIQPPPPLPQQHQQSHRASQKAQALASVFMRSFWWEVLLHSEHTNIFR